MRGKAFFDTNILVYAVTIDDPRHSRAQELLAGGGCVSIQVLNEFVNVSRLKLKISWKDVEQALEGFLALLEEPVELSMQQHRAAITIARLYKYRIYDAMIISSSLAAGCATLYTEDLQHNQTIAGLRISNPFR